MFVFAGLDARAGVDVVGEEWRAEVLLWAAGVAGPRVRVVTMMDRQVGGLLGPSVAESN